MEIAHLTEKRRFSAEKMQKVPLFESEQMFFDQYCLEPGQVQKVHSHASEDKVYLVLQGEATVTVNQEERVLTEGYAAIARAGEPHGVRNDSSEQVILLTVMAPRPAPKGA